MNSDLKETPNLQKQKDIVTILTPKKNSLAKKPKHDKSQRENGHKKVKSNNIKQALVNFSENTNVQETIKNIFADQQSFAANQSQVDTPDTINKAHQDRDEVNNLKPKSPEKRKTVTPGKEWGSLTQGNNFLPRSVKNGSFNN